MQYKKILEELNGFLKNIHYCRDEDLDKALGFIKTIEDLLAQPGTKDQTMRKQLLEKLVSACSALESDLPITQTQIQIYQAIKEIWLGRKFFTGDFLESGVHDNFMAAVIMFQEALRNPLQLSQLKIVVLAIENTLLSDTPDYKSRYKLLREAKLDPWAGLERCGAGRLLDFLVEENK